MAVRRDESEEQSDLIGSMQIFLLIFLMHISELTGCSPDRKIFVLMNNHASHLSVAAIDKGRDLSVVLLTIPPKPFHKLQHLDVSVYGPFKLDRT